jgi:hypothetical protein
MSIVKITLAAALIGGATVALASTSEDRAATARATLDRALAGRVAGRPVDCINLHEIQSSRIIDRTAILYQVGGITYVNRPRAGANALYSDPILVTDTHSSQLCSIDTVNLVDRSGHFWRGFVSLGEFVPYRRAKTE